MPFIKYVFKGDDVAGFIKNGKDADPQKLGEAVTENAVRNGGNPNPEQIAEEARNNRHPFHRHLTFDDAEAARKYRVNEVRNIIRLLSTIEEEETDESPIRAFINVKADAGQAYYATAKVQTSRELQRAVLTQAKKDLDAWCKRYASLKAICRLVAEATRSIDVEIEKLFGDPAPRRRPDPYDDDDDDRPSA